MKKYNKFIRSITYLANCFNKRDNKIWAFTEWYGKRCGDNATFFANYIAENFPDIKIFWLTEKDTSTDLLIPGIRIMQKDSHEAFQVLKEAAVVVMIQGIDEFSNCNVNLCGNALKVNLWHGVMWKKLGYDITGGLKFPETISVFIKNHFMRNYLFEAPSKIYKNIFVKAFGVRECEIIYAGQPRNALFFNGSLIESCRNRVLNTLQNLTKVPIKCTTRIITYMPTFRDKLEETFDFNGFENIQELNEFLEVEDVVLIQKAHFVNNERLTGTNKANRAGRIITNNDFVAQELLAAADMLITDYSSCFFDYLLLDRPIIHFLYDYEYYANSDRGLYFSYKDVACGDVVMDNDTLLKQMKLNLNNPMLHSELRESRRKKFLEYENVNSCGIIANEIMKRIQ